MRKSFKEFSKNPPKQRPTRLSLGPLDAALIVRADSSLELYTPKADDNLTPTLERALLVFVALAFHDPRLQELLLQIYHEKKAAMAAEAKS